MSINLLHDHVCNIEVQKIDALVYTKNGNPFEIKTLKGTADQIKLTEADNETTISLEKDVLNAGGSFSADRLNASNVIQTQDLAVLNDADIENCEITQLQITNAGGVVQYTMPNNAIPAQYSILQATDGAGTLAFNQLVASLTFNAGATTQAVFPAGEPPVSGFQFKFVCLNPNGASGSRLVSCTVDMTAWEGQSCQGANMQTADFDNTINTTTYPWIVPTVCTNNNANCKLFSFQIRSGVLTVQPPSPNPPILPILSNVFNVFNIDVYCYLNGTLLRFYCCINNVSTVSADNTIQTLIGINAPYFDADNTHSYTFKGFLASATDSLGYACFSYVS